MIAGGLENLIKKVVDLRLQPRHLRGETEQLDAMLGSGFVLKPIQGFLAEPLQQEIELMRNVANQILVFVRCLKSCAPDLSPTGLVEIAEVFGEARDQIGLGEQRINRKANFEPLVQLEQSH